MRKSKNEHKCIKNLNYARYATYVTFQQSNPPSENMAEGKNYFSGKHKLYGYKVELSILPIGNFIRCTNHHPGSLSDLKYFE